ncbi:penicillin-binding protein 1B [Psychrobacter sp. I-STPA10]|uniref:penicillin-binding protein 1B n=1 Tax=Psychrobacter sp. I-STPA10 TaxID=2585769 RepID=UPI001E45F683|nr:penicillin-binding protein 1B [Psychrobacter sp. I-STPA10]
MQVQTNHLSVLKPKPPSHNTQKGFVIGFIFLIILIVALILITLYVLKLDSTITSKFEGKRWNIPAKVFSQPLELYQGAEVTDADLQSWLELLNYRSNKQYERTGTYNKAGNDYYIHTRGFKYSANDIDEEQVIKLQLKNGKITTIQSTKPNKVGIVRLEPVTIGGIYPDNNEDRLVVSIDDVPPTLIEALIATEDRGFYEHKGISLRGIARAIYNNFSGKSMQGGSTITQQLIKNFYLNSERSLKRKANEAVMALLLELHYDKREILQTYLNEINLGQNGNRSINGFGLAAQFYFNQPLKELRLDQQAMLVGLAKGPTQYNPRRNPELALERRNTVLHNLLVTGKIDQQTYEQAIAEPLDVIEKASVGKSRFPDFLDIVKRELNTVYHQDDLKNEGLRIFSTLNPISQLAADKAVEDRLAQLRKTSSKTKDLQAALVSANPDTGELVAVVGSGSEFTGFNRAIDAKRQVGSLLKPVIYMTALEKGKYNLASPVDDSPVTIRLADNTNWTPKNYDGRDHGYVPLTQALAKSYNQAAVNTGMAYGVGTFVNQLHRLGIKEKIPTYPSIFLGSVDLSPMDMLGVYQVFASGGFHTSIHSIRSVIDNRGTILQRTGLNTKAAIPADVNYLTNYALQQVVENGTAKKAKSLGADLNLAGKTGTTNDYRDAWFAGYSGNYVSVVWVGRDDNKPIGLSGGSGALPVWIDYMKRLKLAAVAPAQPSTIEWLWLENGTGKLSQEGCENAVYVPVLTSATPQDASECSIRRYEEEVQRQQLEWLREHQLAPQSDEEVVVEDSESTDDTSNSTDDNSDNSNNRSDTWFDKALEWF